MIAFRVHQDNEDKLFTSKSLISYAKSFFTTASNFQIQGLGLKSLGFQGLGLESLGFPEIMIELFWGLQGLGIESFGGSRD